MPKWDATIVETTLTRFAPVFDRQTVYTIDHRGLRFDIFCYLRGGSDRVIVSGRDALVRRRARSLPHFYRWSWYESVPVSFITFNDPTLYLHPDLYCGWCQGTREAFVVDVMDEILAVILKRVGAAPRETIFYGGSAGSFWALMASALKEAVCVVEIPQTDMTRYPDAEVRTAPLEACYGTSRLDALPPHALARLDVAEWYKTIGRTPRKIVYYQNARDSGHVDTQMKPFLEKMKPLEASRGAGASPEIVVKMFSRPDFRSHSPMAVEDSVHAIRLTLDGRPAETARPGGRARRAFSGSALVPFPLQAWSKTRA